MVKRGLAVLAAALFVAGCASTVPTQTTFGTTPTDAQRRDCERNGGYWATASGYCRIGA